MAKGRGSVRGPLLVGATVVLAALAARDDEFSRLDDGSVMQPERATERDKAHHAAWKRLDGADAGRLFDRTHRRIWEHLQRAGAQTARFLPLLQGPPPANLTVHANGELLTELRGGQVTPKDGKRSGAVNTNRLSVVVRGAGLGDEITVRLLNGQEVLGSLTRRRSDADGDPPQLDDSIGAMDFPDTADGVAAHFHNMPERTLLTLEVTTGPCEKPQRLSWSVQTADGASGDAQGRANFIVRGSGEEGMDINEVTKQVEVSVHDIGQRPETHFEILKNGFEPVSASEDLAEPLQEFPECVDGAKGVNAILDNWELVTVRCTLTHELQSKIKDNFLNINGAGALCEGLNASELAAREWAKVQADTSLPDMAHELLRSRLEQADFDGSRSSGPQVIVGYIQTWRYHEHMEPLRPGLVLTLGANLAVAQPGDRTLILDRAFPEEVTMFESEDMQVVSKIRNRNFLVGLANKCAAAGEKVVLAEQRRAQNWWKAKTGRQVHVGCHSMNYRHTGGEGMKGLTMAHIDALDVKSFFGQETVTAGWFNHTFGNNMEDALKHVVLAYNIWVNAGTDRILHQPLMCMDTTTFDKTSVESRNLQFDLESLLIKWSPSNQWYYKSLAQGEGYVFASVPQKGHDGLQMQGTPHSAFDFLGASSLDPPPRRSVEIRCLLVDYSQTVEQNMEAAAQSVPATADQIDGAVVASMRGMITGGTGRTALTQAQGNTQL